MIDLTFTSIILIYILVIGFIGGWAMKYLRANPTFREYATLGGQAGAILVGFGYFTSAFSASSWVGFPGNAYRMGLPFMLGAIIISQMTPYYIIGKRFRALGNRYGLTTIAEYIGERYESRFLHALYALLAFVFLIPYIAVQTQALGMAFQTFGGWPYELACVVVTVVVVGYCYAGGMRAAVWTDVIQGMLMVAISLFFPIIILKNFGGLGGLLAKVGEVRPGGLFPPGDPIPWATAATLISSALMMSLGMCGAPFASQKFLAAKSDKAIYKGSAITTISMLAVNGFFQPIAVLAVIALFPMVPDMRTDNLVYQMMNMFLPIGLSSIFIAGIAAASMSTVDSMMVMASTSITGDLMQKVFKSDIPEEKLVQYSRNLSILVGVIALLMALRPFALIFTMVFFTVNIFAVTAVPLLAGLYWKRATKLAAIISVVVGEITLYTFSAFGPLAKFRGVISSELVVALSVTAVLMIVISFITPPSSKKTLAKYFEPYTSEGE